MGPRDCKNFNKGLLCNFVLFWLMNVSVALPSGGIIIYEWTAQPIHSKTLIHTMKQVTHLDWVTESFNQLICSEKLIHSGMKHYCVLLRIIQSGNLFENTDYSLVQWRKLWNFVKKLHVRVVLAACVSACENGALEHPESWEDWLQLITQIKHTSWSHNSRSLYRLTGSCCSVQLSALSQRFSTAPDSVSSRPVVLAEHDWRVLSQPLIGTPIKPHTPAKSVHNS